MAANMTPLDLPTENDYPPCMHELRTVAVLYRGSIAHGMYVPPTDPQAIDDRDVVGIVIPHPDYYLGLKTFKTKQSMIGQWDWVVWDLKHFVSMVSKANPNALPALWTDTQHWIEASLMWKELVRHRSLFATKQAYHSFRGYGLSQCKRMAKDENVYGGYMGARRKELVDRYGYDIKMASHSVRLLRMGREFLLTGEMVVDRRGTDDQELLEIKQGKWSVGRVRDTVYTELKALDAAYEESPLPEKVDMEEVNKLLVRFLLGSYI